MIEYRGQQGAEVSKKNNIVRHMQSHKYMVWLMHDSRSRLSRLLCFCDQNRVWVTVPVVDMMRFRQQQELRFWLRVVTPARASRAMSRTIRTKVLLARFALAAPANTAIARAMVTASETVM